MPMKPRKVDEDGHDADDVLVVAEAMVRTSSELMAALGSLRTGEDKHPAFAKIAATERWLSNEAWRRLLRVPAATARGAAAKARALGFRMKDAGDDE